MEKFLESYPAVLSVSQVAEILGVNVVTVRKLITNKLLGGIKVGTKYRVPKDRLLDYFETARV